MPYDVLIEYRLAPEREEEAEGIRREFLDAVTAWGDPGFGYRVLRKGPDGHYVHIARLEDEATQKRLGEQDFFAVFTAGMKRITDDTIVATRLEELGAAGPR